jgi:hypothetical protein
LLIGFCTRSRQVNFCFSSGTPRFSNRLGFIAFLGREICRKAGDGAWRTLQARVAAHGAMRWLQL